MFKVIFTLVLFAFTINRQLLSQNLSCLNFNGSSQLVSTTSSVLNTIDTGNFTFEAWIKGMPTNSSTHPTIFSNRSSSSIGVDFFFHSYWGGSSSKMLCIQLNGKNYLMINNGTFNGEILDGLCHHVAVTRNASILTFYVDGVSFGTRNIGDSPTISSPNQIEIGRDPVINNSFNGVISMVKIWSVSLTGLQISESMYCQSKNASGLEAFWKLNEGIGQLVTEWVNNSQDTTGYTGMLEMTDPVWGIECCIDQISNCDTSIFSLAKLILPNVVTANSDNVNDIYKPISSSGILELNFVVFNRWGNLLFQTQDLNINWDASAVSDGIYYYVVRYKGVDQNWKSQQGSIHVFK